MLIWRWVGRPLAWLLAAAVLLVFGSELRPWLDGGKLEATPPRLLWAKLERAALDLSVRVSDVAPLARGQACIRDRDYVCAEFMLQRHLATAPGDRRALGLLAIAQYRLDQYAQNVATSEKAFALGEGNFELFRFYGSSLEQVGRAPEAVKWYYRALALVPASFEVHGDLIKLLMVQGKPDEAMSLATAYDAALIRRGRRAAFARTCWQRRPPGRGGPRASCGSCAWRTISMRR